jgi:hypothetical protein
LRYLERRQLALRDDDIFLLAVHVANPFDERRGHRTRARPGAKILETPEV